MMSSVLIRISAVIALTFGRKSFDALQFLEQRRQLFDQRPEIKAFFHDDAAVLLHRHCLTGLLQGQQRNACRML